MRWRGFLWALAVLMLASAADARAWTTQPHWQVTFEARAYDGLDRLEGALDRLQYEHRRLARARRLSTSDGGIPVQAGSGAAVPADGTGVLRGDSMAELAQLLDLLDERRRVLRDVLATQADPAYQLLILVRLDQTVRVATAVERDIAAFRTGARQSLMMTPGALVTGTRASVQQAIVDSRARIMHTVVRDDHVIARVMTMAGDDLMYWGGQVPMTAGALAVILGLGLLWGKRQRSAHPLVIRVKKEAALILAILGLGACIAGAWIALARHGEYPVVLGTTRCAAVANAHAFLAAEQATGAAGKAAPAGGEATGAAQAAEAARLAPELPLELALRARKLAGELALCGILAADDASAERAERMLRALHYRM